MIFFTAHCQSEAEHVAVLVVPVTGFQHVLFAKLLQFGPEPHM